VNDREGNGESPARPAPVAFSEALRFWWKLGWISFGGPAGQIATMDRELVEKRRWISEKRFLHALDYCMALPGPEAQQLATYVGFLLHGTLGGIVAGTLFVLPSVFVLWLLSWVYMAHGHVPAVDGVLSGFKPAIVAVILYATWRVGKRALRSWLHVALAAAALAALRLGAPFLAVVAGAALVGILVHRLGLDARFRMQGPAHASPKAGTEPARATYALDDDSPTPPHAMPSRARTVRCLLVGLLLWASVEGALVLATGWGSTVSAMGRFFTVAALVTFGGAYAVLPYVAQVAIESRRWLTPGQMVDGLALGETTPGPLIMVVTFVGYVGAWRTMGPEWAPLGLLVATWFTFLPSILLILVGAPHVERVRGRLAWTAPLAAVSAAVVGVIANLAFYLAPPVFLRGGPDLYALDLFALGLFLACGVLLFGLRLAVHWVVLLAGLAGLVRAFFAG
jgi:chromate transporter